MLTGCLRRQSFNGTDLKLDNVEYTLYREDDILGVLGKN